ncbi:hypothetical protein [Marinospirillum insulare]|uniref:Outer membrane protein beta-barrel domain-containing protein n=1 Tax=Marinospirillum insulare TaxID=217169 RepID=A0ABQ5ZXG1_9GAMM|nr:hypothetical protein [Marinospirillum insulare]GLR63705.1 hypothetical protein GCM10007878_11400 [Marinospirillum insulare]
MRFKNLSCLNSGLLITSLMVGLVTSQVALAETQPMFGLRLAMADTDFSGVASSASSTTSGFGVVLGVKQPSYRVYADLNFYTWDEVNTRTIHANYDYLWRADKSWQVFTGIYGGLVDLEVEAANKYQSGPSAGVQAGLLLPLGSSGWSLETGLRYGGFSAKLLNPETNQEVKIKSQAEGFISLSFSS